TMRHPRFTIFVTALAALGGGYAISAQTLTGTVTDSSGAAIPGATITIKSEKTAEERTAKSNDSGIYTVTNLAAASYTITGQAPNLGPSQYTNVPVIAGQERVVNLVLQPATVTQEVNVSAGDLTTIDTSSASVGANINEREVSSLPLNGRQLSQLYLL